MNKSTYRLKKAKEKLETSIHFMKILKIDNPLVVINTMDALNWINCEIEAKEKD
jgi:hypothetical protein